MLGLRRFKTVQIDIWQGQAAQFATDCVVLFENRESSDIEIVSASPLGSAATVIKAPFNQAGKIDTNVFDVVFQRIFAAAENAGSRHLVIPAQLGSLGTDDNLSSFAKTGFRALHNWLSTECPTRLGRVTFIADSANSYHILQEHLFAEYPDELDEEGF